MNKLIQNFVKNYNGLPVSFVCAGGGIGLSDILKVPGASKVCNSIELPYSELSSKNILYKTAACFPRRGRCPYEEKFGSDFKAVCPHTASEFSLYASLNAPIGIGVTAALTTNRYRKGDNHAYIAISTNNEIQVFHTKFTKLSEDSYIPYKTSDELFAGIRALEDEIIVIGILEYLGTKNVPATWSLVQPTIA